ncbi:MAG: hypothetical protein ACYTG2_06650 [Planctomycetota bacterium]|jgi:hypothetical protein
MTSLALSLVATVLSLGLAIWSGIARRRQLHYKLVALTFALLGVAIWRAETYGATLVFEGSALTLHRLHMVSVAVTFLVTPAVVWSGVRLARADGASAEAPRIAHRKAAVALVVLIVITVALGIAMTALARPA